MSVEIILAEDLKVKDFEIPQQRKLYLLLLSYKSNDYRSYYTQFYGTDFTQSECLPIVKPNFSHYRFKNNKIIEKSNQIITIETNIRVANRFLKTYDLPKPVSIPNESIFDKKLLVEVTGKVKKYNNRLDFQDATFCVLTEQTIHRKIVVEKDEYVMKFLQNIASYCPDDWKIDLNTLYGLDRLANHIGLENSQNVDNIHTQQGTIPKPIMNNIRLINDLPSAPRTNSHHQDLINALKQRIVKSEPSVLSDVEDLTNEDPDYENDVQGPQIHETLNATSADIMFESQEPSLRFQSYRPTQYPGKSSTQIPDAGVSSPINDDAEEYDETSHNHTPSQSQNRDSSPLAQVQVPGTLPSVPNCVPIDPKETPYLRFEPLAYSPGNTEPLLVRNSMSGRYELIDTFEIYGKVANSSQLCTINFQSSDDVYRFIYRFVDKEIPELSPEIEQSIRTYIKTATLVNILVPADAFSTGNTEWVAPPYKESAPSNFFYLRH